MDADVSVRELKALAVSMLPPNSALRDLILSEPDLIPAATAGVKVKMYSRLVRKEMGRAA